VENPAPPGYVPLLQRPQNLCWFLHERRKYPVISPAVRKKITEGFVDGIHAFAEPFEIPIVYLESDVRRGGAADLARARGFVSPCEPWPSGAAS
jgi:hypothetical protein